MEELEKLMARGVAGPRIREGGQLQGRAQPLKKRELELAL